jgi:hypothetical protein
MASLPITNIDGYGHLPMVSSIRIRALLAADPGKSRWLTAHQWKIVEAVMNSTEGKPVAIQLGITQSVLNRTLRQVLAVLIKKKAPTVTTAGFANDPLVLRPDLYHVLTQQQQAAGRMRMGGMEVQEIAEALEMKPASCRRLLGDARNRILEISSVPIGMHHGLMANGNLQLPRKALPVSGTAINPPKRKFSMTIPKEIPKSVIPLSILESIGLDCSNCKKNIAGQSNWGMALCKYCQTRFIRCRDCGGKPMTKVEVRAHQKKCSKQPGAKL